MPDRVNPPASRNSARITVCMSCPLGICLFGVEQRKDGCLHLGLGLGLVEISRHGPPLGAKRREVAGEQSGTDKRRCGLEKN
jgi:hypothetical protein